MNIWLVVFLLSSSGDVIGKLERVFPSTHECLVAAGEMQIEYVSTGIGLTAFCMTEDQYHGRTEDENDQYDF